MYDVTAPAVYAHESVMAHEKYRERMNRVVRALRKPVTPVIYSDDRLPDMIQGGLLKNCVTMGALTEVRDPILLFNTFRFDSKEDAQQRAKALQARGFKLQDSLLGAGAFNWTYFDLKDDPDRNYKICRRCWRIHLQHGCLHRCKYCNLGGLLVSMVNVEDYCNNLAKIIERHPWQQKYLLEDDADPVCL